jgi:hypothetical protein
MTFFKKMEGRYYKDPLSFVFVSVADEKTNQNYYSLPCYFLHSSYKFHLVEMRILFDKGGYPKEIRKPSGFPEGLVDGIVNWELYDLGTQDTLIYFEIYAERGIWSIARNAIDKAREGVKRMLLVGDIEDIVGMSLLILELGPIAIFPATVFIIVKLGIMGVSSAFEGDFDPEEEETWLIEDGHYPIAGDKHLDEELREQDDWWLITYFPENETPLNN